MSTESHPALVGCTIHATCVEKIIINSSMTMRSRTGKRERRSVTPPPKKAHAKKTPKKKINWIRVFANVTLVVGIFGILLSIVGLIMANI